MARDRLRRGWRPREPSQPPSGGSTPDSMTTLCDTPPPSRHKAFSRHPDARRAPSPHGNSPAERSLLAPQMSGLRLPLFSLSFLRPPASSPPGSAPPRTEQRRRVACPGDGRALGLRCPSRACALLHPHAGAAVSARPQLSSGPAHASEHVKVTNKVRKEGKFMQLGHSVMCHF